MRDVRRSARRALRTYKRWSRVPVPSVSRRSEEAETEAEVGEDAENTMNKEDEK